MQLTINLQAAAKRIVEQHDHLLQGSTDLPLPMAWVRDASMLELWSVLIGNPPSVAILEQGQNPQEYIDAVMLGLTQVAASTDLATVTIEVSS